MIMKRHRRFVSKFILGLVSAIVMMPIAFAGGHEAESKADLVLVTGATGGTGREIVSELIAQGYRVRAFVRDADKAREKLGEEIEFAVGDVRDLATIEAALADVDALISAIGAGRGDPTNGPEFVDFGGVKNMAEASHAAGLKRMVLVSSMGVTQEDHFLNKMFNNVLLWKFKGEEALRASGVPYTVVRPGGLVNKRGGKAAVAFAQGDDETGSIPRADVARVCVAALASEAAENRTFEINSGEGTAQSDFSEDFAALEPDQKLN